MTVLEVCGGCGPQLGREPAKDDVFLDGNNAYSNGKAEKFATEYSITRKGGKGFPICKKVVSAVRREDGAMWPDNIITVQKEVDYLRKPAANWLMP